MINWRNGKGGLVGGLKYIIKGVFQFAHSITSVSAPPPPQATFGVTSEIDPNGLGVLSSITTAGETVVAGLVAGKGVRSVINADGVSVRTKFEG